MTALVRYGNQSLAKLPSNGHSPSYVIDFLTLPLLLLQKASYDLEDFSPFSSQLTHDRIFLTIDREEGLAIRESRV